MQSLFILQLFLLHFPLNLTNISQNKWASYGTCFYISRISFTDSLIHRTCHGTIMVNLTDFREFTDITEFFSGKTEQKLPFKFKIRTYIKKNTKFSVHFIYTIHLPRFL